MSGSITRRGERWRVVVDAGSIDGRRRQVTRMVDTREAAEAMLAELLVQHPPRLRRPRRSARVDGLLYDLGPLVAALGVSGLARAAGVARVTVQRWIAAGGVDEYTADHLAVAAGEHPALVWSTWLADGLTAVDT